MKKILVCADGNSFWTYNFIKLLTNNGYSVTLWSETKMDYKMINGYYSHSCTVHFSPEYSKKIPSKIRFLFKQISMYSLYRKFDIINIHYITVGKLKGLKLFGYCFRHKIVLSYWGSDLLRNQSQNKLKKYKKVIQNCASITFDNGDLKKEFKKIYNIEMGEVMMFPLPILNEIDNIRKPIHEDIVMINNKVINRKKISVCIGYNRNKSHQHLLILEQLSKLSPKEKDNIILLFPLTYGDFDFNYVESVKKLADISNIEYVCFEEKLSDVEVAQLRINTDVFINGQTTDAFSGSVCECLYAGSIVVNAAWLHYEEFDEYPISYIEFYRFDDLLDIVRNIIKKDNIKIDQLTNKKIIGELRSKEVLQVKWKKYLDDILEKQKG